MQLGKANNYNVSELVSDTVEQTNAGNMMGDESSEGEMEYKEEHRFPNGAIYKGGWKNEK